MTRSSSLITGTMLFITIGLVLTGVVMVLSSSQFVLIRGVDQNVYQFMGRQLIRFSIGLALLAWFATVDYNRWERWARPIFVLNLLLLALVLSPLGIHINGAQRWLKLGITFQPSDLTKLAVICYLAAVWAERRDDLDAFFKGVFFPLTLVGFSLLLILQQPDHGTAGFIGILAIVMWFCAGGRLAHMAPAAAVLVGGVGTALFYKPHLWKRITAFMNPEEHAASGYYQVLQAKIGFAHGGAWGVGLGEGVQQMFTPESHTDFIFATIGEELGFAACAVVLASFMMLVVLGYWTAYRCSNPFGSLVCVGCATAIGLQAALNIAVVSGSVPTTGISLPFISYGGSALIINMIMVGLMIRIARETFEIEAEAPRRARRRSR